MIESIVGMAATGGTSALLGAGLSALGKGLSIAREGRLMGQARNLEEMKVISELMNQASDRGGPGGIWIRRFIVISLFMFMFAALPLNAFIGSFLESGAAESTFVYTEEVGRRWLGLLPGKTSIATTPLIGIPVFKTFVDMGWMIACFYFGSSRIK